jgi:hypothetical protein
LQPIHITLLNEDILLLLFEVNLISFFFFFAYLFLAGKTVEKKAPFQKKFLPKQILFLILED